MRTVSKQSDDSKLKSVEGFEDVPSDVLFDPDSGQSTGDDTGPVTGMSTIRAAAAFALPFKFEDGQRASMKHSIVTTATCNFV